MTTQHRGVCAITYDDAGSLFFLIVHRTIPVAGWELPSLSTQSDNTLADEEEIELLKTLLLEHLGLERSRIVARFPNHHTIRLGDNEHTRTIFIVETSMSMPVNLTSNEHDSYLWAREESADEKLSWESEKRILAQAAASLKAQRR